MARGLPPAADLDPYGVPDEMQDALDMQEDIVRDVSRHSALLQCALLPAGWGLVCTLWGSFCIKTEQDTCFNRVTLHLLQAARP